MGKRVSSFKYLFFSPCNTNNVVDKRCFQGGINTGQTVQGELGIHLEVKAFNETELPNSWAFCPIRSQTHQHNFQSQTLNVHPDEL